MSVYNSTNSQHRVNFKVVIVGERGVGKTSLALRYVKGLFNLCYAVTVGVEFYSKNIEHEQDCYCLQLWDTAGQESFKSLVKAFYNHASCIILAYAHPSEMAKKIRSSLDSIGEFASKEASIFVVRTKTDLCELKEEEKLFLDELTANGEIQGWMQVSARDNKNIDQVFALISDHLISKFKSNTEFRELVEPQKNKVSICLTKESVYESMNTRNMKKRNCCQ